MHALPALLFSLLLLPLALAGPSYSPVWHKQLVGIPLLAPALQPAFHRVVGENKTVLVVATGKGVVAGLNPGDGDIVWRQLHEGLDTPLHHRSFGKVTATLSGPSGSMLRLYTSHTGELIREFLLHPPLEGKLYEPAELGSALAFVEEELESDEKGKVGDVVVLTNGRGVARVGEEGVRWRWEEEDADIPQKIYTSLYLTPTHIHLLGYSHPPTSTPASTSPPQLIHTLLTLSGSKISSTILPPPSLDAGTPSFIVHPTTLIMLHKTQILSFPLDESPKKHKTYSGKWKAVLDVGLGGKGLFVGVREDGGAEVLRGKADGSVERVWEFSDSATSPHYSDSVFSGAVDKQGDPHISRTYWAHGMGLGSMHVWSATAPGGQGMVTGFTFPFKTKQHGTISHVALEVGLGAQGQVVPRFLVTSSTGSMQLWQHDALKWVREEGLAELVGGVAWAEVAREKVVAKHAGKAEGWGPKMARHAGMLWELPFYVYDFVHRFLASADPASTLSESFGLHKLILLASRTGKLFALQSTDGSIAWDRILGVSGAPGGVGSVKVEKVLEVGGVGWVVIGSRDDGKGVVKTVGWEIEPESGKIMPPPGREGTTSGFQIFDGPLLEAFVLKAEGDSLNDTVVLVDTTLQVHVFPDDAARIGALSHRSPRLHFSLPSPPSARAQLTGYTISPRAASFHALQTYTTPLLSSPTSTLLSLLRPARAPIASLGRVTGDKSTFYKYLNPHLVVALTSDPAAAGVCGVHVLDEVSGAVVYEAEVGCGVSAAMVENWLVYHWYDAGTDSRGYRVVTVEFYEGKVDEVTRSLELSSSSFNSTKVHAIAQSYGFPTGVQAMAATLTKYGITVKDILIANDRAQIQAFPRAFLDPRRPRGKLTAEQREEMLMPFDPVIPDDPRRVVSQGLQVAGITDIAIAPTLLESTSLAFAYGLDLFLGRLAPSNTFDILSGSFNKAQLALTVAGLGVAIFITKPIVDRKRMKQRWYSS